MKECPVCRASDPNLIRNCLLWGVVPNCAGNKIATAPRKENKKEDELWEDGD
jgi:hypothetical protein